MSDEHQKNQKNKQYYPPETAGRLMTSRVPTISQNKTIGDIEKMFDERTGEFDSIDYIYVLNSKNCLAGVVSIKEVFDQPLNTKIKEIMHTNLTTVRGHTDRERAAYTALKYNIKAVPVVDADNVFLGVVASDQILQTVYSEASEDIARIAGVYSGKDSFDDVMNISLARSLLHRLPWLLVGLLGGIFAANIIKYFESTIAEYVILAAFIPLVVYMAGATSMQMAVFIIRDSALNPKLKFGKYFFRNAVIVLFIALFSAAVFYGISNIIIASGAIARILSIALFVAISSSIFTGLAIPYLFMKLTLDPANASGPIVTIIQDILSVTIYFTVVTLLL